MTSQDRLVQTVNEMRSAITLSEGLSTPVADCELLTDWANQLDAVASRIIDSLPALIKTLTSFRVGMPCQETTGWDPASQDYSRCSEPAVGIVWHDRESRAYPMCRACLTHNVDRRDAIQLR